MPATIELSRLGVKELEDRADFLESELECTRALLRMRAKQERERRQLARAIAADEAEALEDGE